ncbi:MAG: hypothetical protein GX541_05255 [Clostridiales bacterium]|jgi:uridine kinase|nr:hypothetical protein [Clostridiales bacterium]
MDLSPVLSRIDELVNVKSVVKIAIDGMSGAGKTKLSSEIQEIYDCNVFHMDDFFLTPGLRTPERLSEPGGNVDYERFKREVSDNIGRGGFSYRPYNCKTRAFSEPVKVPFKKLNIVEGVYSLHPVLFDIYDLKVFMYTDLETQRERILERNGAEMLERFISEWIPLENRYFEHFDIKNKCDFVL